ncbi:MAG: histidinol dehydrogenase [Deltaproteobacteria bacterium]|nr:MAG: histidinol dehydrogenase [Deltaproteobacteria bacterium]
MLLRLVRGDRGFEQGLRRLRARGAVTQDGKVLAQAAAIVDAVRRRGDAALLEYTRRYDGWSPRRAADLLVPREALAGALGRLPAPLAEALEVAAERIRRFHEVQRPHEVDLRDRFGNRLQQRVVPVRRVGLYAPGGSARYPSTVLMTAIPARVAGVRELTLVTPTPGGRLDDAILAAAHLSGVDRVVRVGGAQAVAALAFGTRTVPAVDLIVGPGNVYVAAAKRLVQGHVGVDMEAGPSEVVIVADASADPEWIAADLLAQAEHDPRAMAVLVTWVPALVDAVEAALNRQLADLPRAGIARRALTRRGAAILARDRADALALAEAFAPEHLELLIRRPRSALGQVPSAGAVFLGPYTPEAVGDYVAGPSHVLPTAGTARFASGLGVHHFLRYGSVIEFRAAGLRRLAGAVEALAAAEGLEAHRRAVALRTRRRGGGPER